MIGSLVGLLAGWISQELGDFIKGGECNGVVAVEQYIATGLDLYNETLQGTYSMATTHPGQPAPFQCGQTSTYVVSWSIMRDK